MDLVSKIAARSAADYAAALLALLPSGVAWPKELDSEQASLCAGLTPTYARLDGRAINLLAESPAGTALLQLLPEWESTLGLPDPCSGPDPTIALRQAHVRARIADTGGQSVPYFVAYAGALGYAITITEFMPACADALVADGLIYDPSWAHAWQVNVPSLTVRYFRADVSYADEPLATFGNAVLVCELSRVKPAHTVLLFEFGSADLASSGPASDLPPGALTDGYGNGLMTEDGEYLTAF